MSSKNKDEVRINLPDIKKKNLDYFVPLDL
jgi:hypothetical protein